MKEAREEIEARLVSKIEGRLEKTQDGMHKKSDSEELKSNRAN